MRKYQDIGHKLDAERKTPKSQLGFTPFTLYTALSILSLANRSYSLAVDGLMHPCRTGKELRRGCSKPEVERVLEDIVLISWSEDIAGWGCIGTAPSVAALRYAQVVVAKQNLTRRVCEISFMHGVAPSSRSLVHE